MAAATDLNDKRTLTVISFINRVSQFSFSAPQFTFCKNTSYLQLADNGDFFGEMQDELLKQVGSVQESIKCSLPDALFQRKFSQTPLTRSVRESAREIKMEQDDVEMATATELNDNKTSAEMEDMKKRLKEMEDEATALREMQAKVEKEMGSIQDPAAVAAEQANKEEVDSRSIFVGNVDYACTPEEVQQHFQSCGTVNRVTIRTNKYGQPKGYAYVEFLEAEAVQEAVRLNESELHGRQLKVLAKRTNVPGMKQFHPRRANPFMGGRFRAVYPQPFFYPPYGYGKVPRFRMPMRYGPY